MGILQTETVIIGAGPAGLSVAPCLARASRESRVASREFEFVERAETVGSAWRSHYDHYDRLHLHTDKAHSELPFRA